MLRYDFHVRLEPAARQRSLRAGFAAAVHDPVWFLGRQWQMGEHQGENAATPVLVHYRAVHTPLLAPAGSNDDPTRVPAEASVEAEAFDWWTMGRRLRLGAVLAKRAGLTLVGAMPAQLLSDPPPPYEHLAGRFDGLALWRERATLDPSGALFAGLGIPDDRPMFWDPAELVYGAEYPLEVPGKDRALRLPRHKGGEVDWYSADALAALGATPFAAAGDEREVDVYPTAFHYPGAPAGRWWEIEDAAVDIGGYPPDSSHFATTLLIDLVTSHAVDWFMFPVDARVGHVLTLEDVQATDGFGRSYPLTAPPDWWLFRTEGLPVQARVVWLRAMTPLRGRALENVLLGRDEYANLLWAVERRLLGREVAPLSVSAAEELANPLKAPANRKNPGEVVKRFTYVPGRDAAPYWHPYELDERVDATGQTRRRFVQRRLADLSREEPALMPAARALTLRVGEGAGETVHELEPSTIPSIGLVLERSYQLARDVDGQPRLWLQRQRTPVLAPPARNARFDVFADDETA